MQSLLMNGCLKYVIENCETALEELCQVNEKLRFGMSAGLNIDVNKLGAYNRMIQDYLIIRVAGFFDKDTRTASFANTFGDNSIFMSARNENIVKYILDTRNKFVAHSEKEWIENDNFPETDKICNSNLKEILKNLKGLLF